VADERKSGRLLLAIASAAALGGGLGWYVPTVAVELGLVGELWLRALRMLVVPLVVLSMIHGVASLGDLRRLGRLGGSTVAYYVGTSSVAAAIGLVLVGFFRPGDGVAIGGAQAPEVSDVGSGFGDMLRGLVHPNLFAAAAETKILPLILFSLAFGITLTTMGEQGERLSRGAEDLLAVIMRLVHGVMWLAPVGVFGLVAGRFGEAGGGEEVIALFSGLAGFAGVVVLGLGLHAAVLAVALLWLGRRRPDRYASKLGTALTTAFATASSAATLPVTMDGAQEAGVGARTTRFVLPLGATVNMDGSALYEAVAALFIAQAWGIELDLTAKILVVLTAILSSIGAAGIPEAGLVTMVIVLQAVGLPLEGLGLLLAIDWLLDRFRTAVNVWGDSVGAAVLDQLLDVPEEVDEPVGDAQAAQ